MPVEFQQRTLSNGLTIIAEVDRDAHSSAAGFFVKTGARDESPELMGVSHYLEHMMFKGTESLSADDLNRRFDAIGARQNAFTSTEMTCFYAQVLPERLDQAIDLLGQMMRPALRQSDFDTEKQVILEEIAMYRDNPFWVLYEEASDRHFRTHPMGHRVLGTDDTIKALERDQMLDYFEDRYSADNTVLALSGRLDFDKTVDQVEALCGHWPATGARRDAHRPRVGAGTFDMQDANVARAYLIGLADAPAINDDRRYAAAMLAAVLGTSDNSRLHWGLLETGLAEEAQAAYDPHDGIGQYFVYASGDPAKIDDIWAAIGECIVGLVDSIDESDLERLRNRTATAVTLSSERPGDRMQRLGRLWTYLETHLTLEEELARITSLTVDDLKEVAEAFPIQPATVGRLLPQ